MQKHRGDFTVFSHLDHGVKGGHGGVHAFLTGVKKEESSGFPEKNISVDQVAAEHVGSTTRYRHEADAFFAWLKEHKIGPLTVICGDRHWQYHSIHPSGIEEFACGALNDENARMGVAPGNKNGSDPEARIRQLYTSPTPNGGFLQITAGTELVFEHFDCRGKRLYRAVKKGPFDK